MRKIALAAIATASIVSAAPIVGFVPKASAAPVSVDFTALPSGTQVTSQYPGVSFSLYGGNASGAPEIAAYGAGLSNSPYSGNYPTAERLVATFAMPVTGVRFKFSNEGYNGGNYYEALDSSSNVLASGALNGNVANVSYDLSGVTGISTIFWDNGFPGHANNWTQALGSITYLVTDVPEPATIALLGAGLVALGVRLRKRHV